MHVLYHSFVVAVERNAFVPLVDVVGVLPQQHTAEQERAPGHQPLQPGQPHLQHSVWLVSATD